MQWNNFGNFGRKVYVRRITDAVFFFFIDAFSMKKPRSISFVVFFDVTMFIVITHFIENRDNVDVSAAKIPANGVVIYVTPGTT